MAVDHYENFPVASLLLPAHLRQAVRDVYRFARSADDIADEGDAPPAQRLARLAAYRQALRTLEAGGTLAQDDPLLPIFGPLGQTAVRHALPWQLFHDLLDAFGQDVAVHRYADLPGLLDYCRRSANPVGRLMLRLYEVDGEQALRQSDAVCTGLQLANFWQDVALDWRKGRIYLPQDAMHRHGVTEAQIAEGRCDAAWRALMAEQTALARRHLEQGHGLPGRLPWRAGCELRLVIQGGLRILTRLDHIHYDVFAHRPTLRKRDWLILAWRAVFPGAPRTHLPPISSLHQAAHESRRILPG